MNVEQSLHPGSAFWTSTVPASDYSHTLSINRADFWIEIIGTIVISCLGGQDCGGLYVSGSTTADGDNLPVRECRFVGCIANGIASWINNNDTDVDGLIFWDNKATLGFSDSLFAT